MTDFEELALKLEATGNYRVLRRLQRRRRINEADGTPTKRAVFIDFETTGLDVATCEVVELGMVPFDYSADGRIFEIGPPLEQLNQPREPIPAEVTALTGITDDEVQGHTLDLQAVVSLVEPAALLIAHNAAFDRPIAERLSPVFAAKPWACSMCEVPWKEEGIEGRRLSDLLTQFGFFFGGHRAADDCLAAIELLAADLPKSKKSVMSALLDVARQKSFQIVAEGAPFESKDILKRNGYRWNPGSVGSVRAWWKEVSEAALASELEFLSEQVFHGAVDVPIRELTALERFSLRSGAAGQGS